MAIEKMKLVNIIGGFDEFDRIVSEYIIDTEIHMENIFNVINNSIGMYPYSSENPYNELFKLTTEVFEAVGIDTAKICTKQHTMSVEEIREYVDALNTMVSTMTRQKNELTKNLEENNEILQQLTPIQDVDVNLDELFNFKYVKMRFGTLTKESYSQMETFLDEYESMFFKFGEDNDKVYGAYFVPAKLVEKVDSIYSSLYFQRTRISSKAHGTPAEAIEKLKAENAAGTSRLTYINEQIKKILIKEHDKLCNAYCSIKYMYDVYSVRRYAAHTDQSFYLAGWVPERLIAGLTEQFDKEPNVIFIAEDAGMVKNLLPPTKLNNPKLFKPFEGYVKMYGIPNYHEIDPTVIFALTYSIMFGIMYGDVGHGAVLAIVGLLMAKKKNFLGPILTLCGIVSAVFGVLFGSIFGDEEIIGQALYRPFANQNIMTTLLIAVGMGVVLVTVAMLLNVINGIRQKDGGKVLFNPNGLAGMVFYWAVIIAVIGVLMGNSTIKTWYIVLFVVLPLVLMFINEPLSHLMAKRKDWMPKNKGQFILETFFEMFELLLSYITNTISFIRVGAFALIHAGMLTVVFTLAQMAEGASSMLVVVIGNIVVIGLEGLLVSIQVLRLEFYEMFSRYYSGNGKLFKKLGGM